MDGKKILHMDRNDYYGAESASVNLNQLFEKFKAGAPPGALGASRDFNIDLQPKFLMANGKLVKMLVMTGVNKYLEFKQVDGSYVLKDGKINKVPATDTEALSTPLVVRLCVHCNKGEIKSECDAYICRVSSRRDVSEALLCMYRIMRPTRLPPTRYPNCPERAHGEQLRAASL